MVVLAAGGASCRWVGCFGDFGYFGGFGGVGQFGYGCLVLLVRCGGWYNIVSWVRFSEWLVWDVISLVLGGVGLALVLGLFLWDFAVGLLISGVVDSGFACCGGFVVGLRSGWLCWLIVAVLRGGAIRLFWGDVLYVKGLWFVV